MVIGVAERGDVCIVRIEGRFVTGVDPVYLQAKLDELKLLSRGSVLVDLQEMSYVGSTGLGFIVGIFTSVVRNSGKFVVTGLQPQVRNVFDLTRISTIIPSAADLESGLAALGSVQSAGAADASV